MIIPEQRMLSNRDMMANSIDLNDDELEDVVDKIC